MPRSLRAFVAGGVYHPYNRFGSGDPVFADPEKARPFIVSSYELLDKPLISEGQ